MFKYLILGSGFAFAAAVQPGPLQAFLLSRVLRHGWRRTLPAALAPVISDGPIAALMLLVLRTLPAGIQRGLHLAGGVYLLALAWAAFRETRLEERDGRLRPAAPSTLRQAVVVNLLNPNPYLGWAFVLGPAAVTAWAEAPVRAVGFVASFYLAMTVTLGAFIAACGRAERLSPRTQYALTVASAVVLAGLGAWQIALARP